MQQIKDRQNFQGWWTQTKSSHLIAVRCFHHSLIALVLFITLCIQGERFTPAAQESAPKKQSIFIKSEVCFHHVIELSNKQAVTLHHWLFFPCGGIFF